jgi:adenylyltransferase/sulfurtransferase
MVFNGAANRFYTTQFQRREDCLSHETLPELEELDLSATSHTAADLFHRLRPKLSDGTATLQLDRDLVVSLECRSCSWQRSMLQPLQQVALSAARCDQCGETAVPHLEHSLAADHPLCQQTLRSLGVAPYDIVRVSSGSAQFAALLAGDRDSICRADSRHRQ